MFSIEVSTAFFIKIANIVAIEGKPVGELEGNILYDEKDKSKKYIVKGVAMVNSKEFKSPLDSLTLQLEPGNYVAEELIGKRLISME